MKVELENYQDLATWWNRGILFHKLKGKHAQELGAVKKSLRVLAVGLFVTIIVELAVIVSHGSRIALDRAIGVTLYGLIHAGNIAFFILVLYLSLLVFAARPQWPTVASFTCYAFSGLMPLSMMLLAEQLSEAIKLFVDYRDPGRPYLSGATIRLLFPEEATPGATIRAWLLISLQAGLFIWYILFHLRRTLVESTSATHPKLKVSMALLVTITSDTLFVHYYFERAYWSIMRAVLGE